MNITKFFRSFIVGFAGIGHVIAKEQNMRVHLLAATGVIAAGFAFRISPGEWIAILFCIALVLSGECLNTALERLADRVSMEKDPLIKQAKDCGSGAVLILAIFSAIVGGIVFLPKIWMLIGG